MFFSCWIVNIQWQSYTKSWIIGYGILILYLNILTTLNSAYFSMTGYLQASYPLKQRWPGACSPASFPGSWGWEERRPWEWSRLRSPYWNIRPRFFAIHIREESKCSVCKLVNVAVNDHQYQLPWSYTELLLKQTHVLKGKNRNYKQFQSFFSSKKKDSDSELSQRSFRSALHAHSRKFN